MGSTLNKGAKMIDKSRDKFTLLTTQITVMDGEQTVYKYSENVEMVEGNAEITKSTSKLNSSFEFSTVEDIQVVENANRDKFINFVLDKNLIEEAKFEKDILTLSVKGENLAKFLSYSSQDFKTDEQTVTATLTFENKLLKTAVLNFTLQSGKTVKLTLTCNY
jgi:hypothetical protein